MESTIELSVLKKEIHFVKKDSLTTGQQRNSIKISFNGKEWNGLTKYGVFKVEDTVKDVLITNSDIEIPAEVCTLDNLGKVVYFGIKGTYTETIDGTKTETVYTTPYFRLGVLERGTETSGNIPEYPTQNAIDAAIENARRWAVGPSSPYKVPTDTNNAKYWSRQAEKFANILSEAGNNESERIKAEKERQNNENIRQSNEAAREVWEGYNQDKTYYKGNKVSLNGNSYVCVVESTTNQPGQSKNWLLIAQKGDGLVIKDKYTTIEELRIANPNHTYIYQVEQPNGELYIYSDAAKDWVSIGTIQGPKGETGEKGDKGDQGIRGEKGEKGDTGASNILTIGSVTSGSAPAVTITGDSPNQVLNFVLEKGDKGEQGEPGTRGEKGEKGDKGDKGEKGNAFTYADFTPDQLAALKGEKGETGPVGPKGDTGPEGAQGPRGETGKGLTVLSYYASKAELDAAKKATAQPGDAYGVGTAQPYDIYIFDGKTSGFVNNGPLQGAKGDTGPQGLQGEQGIQGETGPAGADGKTPVKGTDYFTPTDVNEIAAEAAKKVDVSGKLDKTGDGSNVTAAFTAASTRANVATGEKLSVLFGKIAKWFADLGSLAFKSTVSKSDLASDVQTSLGKADSALQSAPVTSVNSKTGAVSLAKGDVGLGNVENVKQYSASNPPPYPVTSVNGKTGAVTVSVPTIPSTTSLLKGDGSGGVVAATRGSDYIASGNIVKQTLVATKTTPTENNAINWYYGS